MKKLAVIISLLCLGLVQAQNFNKSKMDCLFQLVEAHHKGMGSISIFSNGKEIYQNSIGYADLANEKKANAQTQYRIGSISKTFTAVIIMQLVEEGKLELGTKLGEFFPGVPNADKISLEQMLGHTSGISDVTRRDDFMSWVVKPQSREQMLKRIEEGSPEFAPGERTEYSNTNYILLSYIAEDVEHMTYPEILQSRIVEPLGLKRTEYGDKIETDKNEALSYVKEVSGWKKAVETGMSAPMGAGGIVSTPSDLNIFLDALFNGKLVSQASLEKMEHTEGSIGLGLLKFPLPGKVAYGHKGRIDGFESVAAYFPKDKISIAYTANAVDMPFDPLMFGVFNILFGNEQYQLPDFSTPENAPQLTAEDLKAFVGTYSNPDFELKMMITQKGDQLIARASGQSTFPLQAVDENKFKYDRYHITITFLPEEDAMVMEQTGEPTWKMKRE